MISSPMTPDEPLAESREPAATRILLGLGGVVAFVVGLLITLGAAVIGCIAIAALWILRWKKRRPATTIAAWVASVASTIVVMGTIFALGTLLGSKAPERTPQQMAADRARARESMPAWMRGAAGSPQQNAAADSVAQTLLEKKGAMVWLVMIGGMIGTGLLGGYAGTVAWAVMMVLYRAYRGEWPRARDDAQAEAATF
jgi:hypothetical protein